MPIQTIATYRVKPSGVDKGQARDRRVCALRPGPELSEGNVVFTDYEVVATNQR